MGREGRNWRGTLSAVTLAVAALALVSSGIALEKPRGSLEGRVVDADTHKAVAAADVYGEGWRAVTDSDGRFRLTGLPVGAVGLTVMANGYQDTYRGPGRTIVAEGRTSTVGEVALKPVPDSIRLHASRIPQPAGKPAELTCAGRLRDSSSFGLQVHPLDIVAWAKTREYYAGPSISVPGSQPLKAWTHTLAHQTKHGSFRETIKLPELPPGGYLVVARSGRTVGTWPLLITDIALVVKQAPTQLVAYVTGFTDGQPRRGVEVRVVRSAGAQAGLTDERGIFTCEGRFDSEVFTVARDSASAAWTRSSSWAQAETFRVFTYTDRPVYRPGHLVHIKGIVRRMQDREYATYAAGPVQVQVRSPRGSDVLSQTLRTNAFGTYHLAIQLSPEAELGYYDITTRVEGEEHSGGFQVEEYRKPEYEVTVTTKEPVYVGKVPIQAAVEARYYFGARVAHANVSYSVYANPYYAEGLEGFWQGGEEYYGYGESWTTGTTITDETGVARILVPIKELESAQEVVIEAQVTDAAGRPISGRGKCLAVPSAVLIRMQPDRWFYEPGEQAKVEVQVTDYEGQPQPDKPLRLLVERLEWAEIKGKWQEQATPVQTLTATTDAKGRAEVAFEAPQGGEMRLTAIAADSAGHEAREELHVWLAGKFPGYYQAEARQWTVSVVPDKQAYLPGETAKVLVSSSAKRGVALVTVEGEKVYDTRLVDISHGPGTVEIPLRLSYAPEIQISACLVSEERYGQDERPVRVSPKSRYLTVKVRSDSEKYQPGQTASYQVSVVDEQGRPARAEVSLGVVDESVYAVRPDSADMQSAFYGQAPVYVSTQHSFPEEYYAGAGDKEAKQRQVQVRRYFPDTALWAPTLLTGPDGTARVSLRLPDSLTTWRATARAITPETQVGTGRSKLICQRPLVARLVVPRFFTQGDEVEIAGLVHNYTEQTQRVAVSLQAEGLDLSGAQTQQVQIASQGAERCAWQVKAQQAGTAKLTLLAKGTTASDALELSLPVLPFGIEKVIAQAGTAASVVSVPLDVPRTVIPETVDLRVDLTPTPANACFASLDYLVGFPYGCVEQTMSRFLPDILLKRLLQMLGIRLRESAQKLEEAIQQSLDRIWRFQHSDGGWGWWEYDDSDPYMTAYVLYGLAHTRAAGYQVDEKAMNQGLGFLRSHLERLKDTRDQAYVLRSLALLQQAPAKALKECYDDRVALDGYSLALLATALGENGGAIAQADGKLPAVMNALRQKKRKAVSGEWWDSRAQRYSWLDSTIEATAEASKALLRYGRGPDEARPAIRWLLHARTGNHWPCTKESALAISAIGEYAERMQIRQPPDYTATVTLNDAELQQYRVTRGNMFRGMDPIRADARRLQPGGHNTLAVGKEGRGELDFALTLRYFLKAAAIPAAAQGIEVQRQYFLMAPKQAKAGQGVEYEEQPFKGVARKGQQVRCRVTVKALQPCDYVVVEVPRPSGCEVIEQPSEYGYGEGESEGGHYTQREDRDEKTVLFLNSLGPSWGTVTFDMRAEIAGAYNVLPAAAAGMYHPEVRGNSAATRFVIEAQ